MKLNSKFFARPTLQVARQLLGQVLAHRGRHGLICGRIVETEAYLADDPACHAARGKTARCAPMFGPAGRSYVYFTYGMYHCFNIVTEPLGRPGAVLIRAVEPVKGMVAMLKFCQAWPKTIKTDPRHKLASGPGKLCVAFGFDRKHNDLPLFGPQARIYVESAPPVRSSQIVTSTRIGITQNAEAPYRFYIRGHPSVSKP